MKSLCYILVSLLISFTFFGCQRTNNENVSTDTPQLNIVAASFENNAFTLKEFPNDATEILSNKGHLQLEVDVQSLNEALNEALTISAQINLGELGSFDLYTTSEVRSRNAQTYDLHRNIKDDGAVLERVKGKSRTIEPTCRTIRDQNSCYVINKNSYRHFTFDLHLNEALHTALANYAQDLNGSVTISLSTANLGLKTYTMPIVYIHTPVAKITPFSDSSNINESYSTNSGDSEYFSHTTSNTATTTTNGNGQVTYSQAQSINILLDQPSSNANSPRKDSIHSQSQYPLSTMKTSITSGDSENVDNTQFNVEVSSNNATIWNITQRAGSPTPIAKGLSAKSSTYNPQNEIVWKHCANEGETCNLLQFSDVKGTVQVRYGTSTNGEHWSYTIASDQIGCNNGTFGDPAHGILKTCEYMVPPSYAPTWTRVAKEYSTFNVSTPENMRFGHNGNWNPWWVNGTYNCSTSNFGDPAHGIAKWCEIMTDEGAPPLNYEYVHCANEGEFCAFDGSAVIRYGAVSSDGGLFYVYNIARDGVQCSNSIAGDNYYKVGKSCDYLRYKDPNSRQNSSNKIWSTNNAPSGTIDVASYEQVMAEVEYSKDFNMRWFWGLEFTAGISLSGEAGVQANAYLDTDNRTFSLIGGPEVHIDSAATGSVSTGLPGIWKAEVGIEAPISVLDIYSPFTVAFTVKPGVLTANVSLDYFIDVMSGEVVLYYKYSDFMQLGNSSDNMTLYSWNPIYQDSGTLYTNSLSWNVNLVKDYILPAIPDGYFKEKIGFSVPDDKRDYFLYVGGVLEDIPNGEYAHEYVTITTLCGVAETLGKVFTFTGNINQEILLSKGCSMVEISGIRAPSWSGDNGLSIGVREK